MHAFSDVVGLMRFEFIGKSKYFVPTFDSYSCYCSVRFTHREDEASDAIVRMFTELQNLFTGKNNQLTTIIRHSVNWLKSDGRGECMREAFQN